MNETLVIVGPGRLGRSATEILSTAGHPVVLIGGTRASRSPTSPGSPFRTERLPRAEMYPQGVSSTHQVRSISIS